MVQLGEAISRDWEALESMALSNNIRKLRFAKGRMTQKQLADLVGVSRQTMNAIENGKSAPTIDIAIRIADVFLDSVESVFQYNYDCGPDILIVEVEFN